MHTPVFTGTAGHSPVPGPPPLPAAERLARPAPQTERRLILPALSLPWRLRRARAGGALTIAPGQGTSAPFKPAKQHHSVVAHTARRQVNARRAWVRARPAWDIILIALMLGGFVVRAHNQGDEWRRTASDSSAGGIDARQQISR